MRALFGIVLCSFIIFPEAVQKSQVGCKILTICFDKQISALNSRKRASAESSGVGGLLASISYQLGQPRLAASDQSQNNGENRDESGRDSRKVVSPPVNEIPKLDEHQPDAVDGAIIVIGIFLGIMLAVWIVTTTPGRPDGKNNGIDKNRERGGN